MTERSGLEGSFLQPKSVAEIGGRLGDKFIWRVARRLMGSMTNRTAFLSLRRFVRRIGVAANDLDMFVVRKGDREIGFGSFLSFRRLVKELAWIWEWMTGADPRSGIRMTDRTDDRGPPAKELCLVTAHAGLMLWIIGYVLKCV